MSSEDRFDPFDGVVFDEDFARAGRREPSAAERLAQAERAREYAALLEERRRLEKKARRRRRRDPALLLHRLTRILPVVALLLLVGGGAWQMTRDGSAAATMWVAGPHVGSPVRGGGPTPVPAPSDSPLGQAPTVAASGAHTYMAAQPGGIEPVAYDPCRPIRVVINARTAPPGVEQLVSEALAATSSATGLRFEVEGMTDEVPRSERSTFQEDRYGDRWAPVLIAWSDPVEMPELAGEVAGIGGSSWIEIPGGPAVYVSGIVALDGPQFAEILTYPDGREQALAVILHELGHLVGLGHVDDQGELMHPRGHPFVTTFQDGDLAGLARLGAGECVPEL